MIAWTVSLASLQKAANALGAERRGNGPRLRVRIGGIDAEQQLEAAVDGAVQRDPGSLVAGDHEHELALRGKRRPGRADQHLGQLGVLGLRLAQRRGFAVVVDEHDRPALSRAPDPVALALLVVCDHAVAVGVDVDAHVQHVQLDRELVEHLPDVVDVVDERAVGARLTGQHGHQALVGQRRARRFAGLEHGPCVVLDVADLQAFGPRHEQDAALALVELKASARAPRLDEPQLRHLASDRFERPGRAPTPR